MNFGTARLVAAAGHPVAPAYWVTATSAKWLTRRGNTWFLHTSAGRAVVAVGDVTEADLRLLDWRVPTGCEYAAVAEQPNFPEPGGAVDTGGGFDVLNPPCRI